jgi:hypothetical protein
MHSRSGYAKHRVKALLMLALLLVQCLIIAVEVGASTGAASVDDVHHEVGHDAHQKPHYKLGESSAVHELDDHSPNCDHCCFCHGHGAHVALPTKFLTSDYLLLSDPISQNAFVVIVADLATIYRPPIC